VLKQIGNLVSIGKCPPIGNMPACEVGLGATSDGLPVYVIQSASLYERCGAAYGDDQGRDWPDNDVRFARFSSAAAALAAGGVDPNWSADVVHANDWQCGLISAYLAWDNIHLPTILTIHNLAYQGLFARESLSKIGAPESAFHIDGLEFYDKLSFLKAGIVTASHLTTVSQNYAREITSPEFGCGLEGLLKKRAEARELSGILNGIDESWDPRYCTQLHTPFGAGEWHERSRNAEEVRRDFGLAVSRGPLFALVARLVHQKGVDLLVETTDTIVRAGGQIVVMGKGEPRFEEALLAATEQHPQSIGVKLGFCDGEARRIFAGSDFTLMPSRFEPCGLSQMYAQRFGSLPIGHRTGGLAETIADNETGFLFDKPSTESFLGSLCRAFSIFGAKDRFEDMRCQAMKRTFDWSNAAREYGTLYKAAA
jgi:starch synthase